MCYFIARKQISLYQWHNCNITDTIIFCISRFYCHEYISWSEKLKNNSNLLWYIFLGFSTDREHYRHIATTFAQLTAFTAYSSVSVFSGGKPLLLNYVNDKFDVSSNNISIDSISISIIKYNRLYALQIHVLWRMHMPSIHPIHKIIQNPFRVVYL